MQFENVWQEYHNNTNNINNITINNNINNNLLITFELKDVQSSYGSWMRSCILSASSWYLFFFIISFSFIILLRYFFSSFLLFNSYFFFYRDKQAVPSIVSFSFASRLELINLLILHFKYLPNT